MPRKTIKATLLGEDRYTPVARKVQGSILGLSTAIKTLGVATAAYAVINVGRDLVRGLQTAVSASAEFEKSLSRVAGLSGSTGQEMSELSDIAKDLGRSTVFSASEAADAMGEFAKAGFSASEIAESIGPALNLAAAGQIELAQATEISTKVLKSMGKETSELSSVVDILAKAATSSATTVGELGESFKHVGAVASASGASLETVVATMGALASAGIPAELSATQLRNLFAELKKNTDGVTTSLGKFRVEVFDSTGAFVGMSTALDRMIAAGITTDNVYKVFEKRLASVVVAALNNRDAIAKMETELGKAGGTAERLSKVFLDNLKGAFVRLDSAVTGLRIEIGGNFQDVLKVLIDDGLVPITNKVSDLISSTDDWRNGIIDTAIGAAEAVKTVVILTAALQTLKTEVSENAKGFGRLKQAVPFIGQFAASIDQFRSAVEALGALDPDTLADLGFGKLAISLRALTDEGGGVDDLLQQFSGVDTSGLDNLIAKLEALRESRKDEADGEGERKRTEQTRRFTEQTQTAQTAIEALNESLKKIDGQTMRDIALDADNLSQQFALLFEAVREGTITPEQFEAALIKLQQMKDEIEALGGTVSVSFGSTVSKTFIGLNEAIDAFIEGGVPRVKEAMESIGAQGVAPLADSIDQAFRVTLVSGALRFGDALVDAARGGDVAFDQLVKDILAGLAKMIVQAVLLKTILAALNIDGGTGGFFTSIFGFGSGGVVKAQDGVKIPLSTGIIGRDSVPALLAPGERVLSVEQNQAFEEGRLGGPNVGNITLNISTIDARSFKDLLRDNPEAIAAGIANAIDRRTF